MKSITQAGLVATAMIAVSLAAAWGVMTGVLGHDAPVRVMMVFNALILAYYGNAIPKAVLRTPVARTARRFAGWVFVLGGLISAPSGPSPRSTSQRRSRSPSQRAQPSSPSAIADCAEPIRQPAR